MRKLVLGFVTKSDTNQAVLPQKMVREPQWLSGRASDSGGRGPGFKPDDRRVVYLSKTL